MQKANIRCLSKHREKVIHLTGGAGAELPPARPFKTLQPLRICLPLIVKRQEELKVKEKRKKSLQLLS